MSEQTDEELQVKFVVVGDNISGKTELLISYTQGVEALQVMPSSLKAYFFFATMENVVRIRS